MAQLKNIDGFAKHLQRIFIYGDEAQEDSRVDAFADYLATHVNPFTGQVYEVGKRSLYRYIAGEQHFPVEMLPALISWSLDTQLMTVLNMYPAPSDLERMQAKIDEKEKKVKAELEDLKAMKSLMRKR